MSHQSEQALDDEFICQLESLDYEYVDIHDISQLKDNL